MNNLIRNVREGIYYAKKCLDLLHQRDRKKLSLYLILQLLLTSLDVLGILLIAGIASIASWAIQGNGPSGRVLAIIEKFNLQNQSAQNLAIIFASVATALLVSKSLFGFYLTKRSLIFLAKRDAEISSNLSRNILQQDMESLRINSSFEYQNAITIGSNAVTSGLISQVALLITEVIMQLVIFITLFVFAPEISLILFAYFFCFLILLTFKLGRSAKIISQSLAELNISTSRTLFEAVQNFRIVKTSNVSDFFAIRIRNYREQVSFFNVEQSMLSVWSKFAYEIAMLLAAVIFSAYAFLLFPAAKAASLLALFLAAAYRIAPSIMKVQAAIVQIKGSIGSAKVFFKVLDEVNAGKQIAQRNSVGKYPDSVELNPRVLARFDSVDFAFRDQEFSALNDISLRILRGERIGLVGPSGAGKSTFVDLLMGLLKPSRGTVELIGTDPATAILTKAISVGYVPQEVILVSGTIRDNLAFGVETNSILGADYWKVLESVGLAKWVRGLPSQLDTPLGEFNSSMSGGQRQRIGIARALINNPDVLILDESTSALDAESEKLIIDFMMKLDSRITLIVIAHRLSTVRNMDVLYYFEKGRLISSGSFNQLRQLVPNFDLQAKLLNMDTYEERK